MPEFVALHAFVRAEAPRPDAGSPAADPIDEEVVAAVPDVEVVRDAVREALHFRAALADAFDASLARLHEDLAADVLARELQLAPADLRALACRTLERFANDLPVQLRVHPDELTRVAGLAVPAAADPTLRRGDVYLDLHAGGIDARLGVRLEAVLRTAAG